MEKRLWIEPFRIGNTYRTRRGEHAKLIGKANEGTSYETVFCEKGVHRYSNRPIPDMGRCTGRPSDHENNLVLLFYEEP